MMKKAGLTSKRLTKRRINTDIVQLKNFKDFETVTNLIQASKEKLPPEIEPANAEETLNELFSEEEAEAEHLLDELNWNGTNSETSSNNQQLDLQLLLGKQSEQLNCEIIDFLLQWEEMDDTDNANSKNVAKTTVTLGVRDTREVLTALSLVDTELAAVDLWLGEQIERLGEIQSNLHMIEDESGALETSWLNLNVVQEVVQTIVQGYSIDARHEKLLSAAPEELFSFVIKSASLNSARSTLRPLLEALSALRTALDMKALHKRGLAEADSTNHGMKSISPAQWKQLQSIAAVTTQRAKLTDLADTFCRNFRDFCTGLFDMLLRHKALTLEGSTSSVVVKQFSFQPLIDKYVSGRGVASGFKRTADVEASSAAASKEPTALPRLQAANNQLLQAQQNFQTALADFVPLLDVFVALSPSHARPLCEAYIHAAQGLHQTLVRTMTKDLNAQVLVLKVPQRLSLSTCGRYRIGAPHDDTLVPLRFQHVKQPPGVVSGQITSWMALRVALLVLAPAIDREEQFVSATFRLDRLSGATADGALDMAAFAGSKLCAVLDAVFEPALARVDHALLHCGAADGAADGVEVVALLTVLYQFSQQYPSLSPLADEQEASGGTGQELEEEDDDDGESARQDRAVATPHNVYLYKMLGSFRSSLLARLSAFGADQVAWIGAQKADLKAASVLPPFARFPTLILQLVEMTNGIYFDCVDDLLCKVARELLSWLTATAKLSDKYADKLRITNFTFFECALRPFGIAALDTFVEYAAQQRQEGMARYVNWMVAYEFPALSALAVRMDGVGHRVNEEELSLYIRRKDVLNVVKEVEVVRTLEASVSTMRKRLEKHFLSEYDSELNLVAHSWQQIKSRVVRILTRLEEAASASYQITLDVGPKTVRDIFDKYASAGSAPPATA